MEAMTARDIEDDLLSRCAAVAQNQAATALDQREANVFRVAAMVIHSQFPQEANALKIASDRYFSSHPDDELECAAVVRHGWVMNLPRFRDMLARRLY